MWRRYYERWTSMTIDGLGLDIVDLVPDLARFVPPARTFDKYVYSPWIGSDLHAQLRSTGVDTVIVTGGRPTSACWPPYRTGRDRLGLPGRPRHRRDLQLRRRDPRLHVEHLLEPVRAAGGVREDGNPSYRLARELSCERSAMKDSYLVQILLPIETDNGEQI
jgi:hypothetical protein